MALLTELFSCVAPGKPFASRNKFPQAEAQSSGRHNVVIFLLSGELTGHTHVGMSFAQGGQIVHSPWRTWRAW
jgi:hypothetical protein